MKPQALAAFLVLSTLAACSEPEVKKAEAPPAPAAPPVLGGVNLTQPISALGTEPFWSVGIEAGNLSWSTPEQPTPVSAPATGPTVLGATAVFTASIEGQPLVVTLIATECSDGMSDRTYPLTAQVQRGADRLTGCAAPKAMLAAQPAP